MDYLRLALATLIVLAPGWLVARALGQRSVSATLAWATAAVFVAWLVVFVVHGGIWLAVAVLAAIGLVAAAFAWRRRRPSEPTQIGLGVAIALGLVLGILLWHVAGVVNGDGLFHLARVRKLVELGNLHLTTVDEFKDGGLHPGYAFPLWHGFLALVAKVSGLDPSVVVLHAPSMLAPLATAVVWESGVAVFRKAVAGFAVLVAQLGIYCFAAGHGGSYVNLGLPATVTRQIYVPAAIALFFLYVESRRPQDIVVIAAIFGGLALIHPTYAIFLLIPLGAYALVRVGEWRTNFVAIATGFVPAVLVALWLKPIVDQTRSHDPAGTEKARALRHYADQLDVWSPHRYRLDPAVISRSGAVAVAALALLPLAFFAARRRWGAFVLAGSLSILVLMLVPELFVRFSNVVSLSQARRAAGFVPFAFVLVGVFALLARSVLVLPLALAAGIVLQLQWPGNFAYGGAGGPGSVTWIALVGGAAALAAGLALRREPVRERWGLAAVAVVLFCAPVALHALRTFSPRGPADRYALSPRIKRELKRVPPRAVVIAPLEMSYRILAAAPVYVVAAPPAHVADTTKNRPYERLADLKHWLATGDPAIPRKYGATWEVSRGHLRPLNVG